MKKKSIVIGLVASTLIVACKQQTAEQPVEEVVQVVTKEKVVVKEPVAEKEGKREYKVQLRGSEYAIVVQRKPNKEAPVVKDILDTPFYDNMVYVTVMKDGVTYFDKVFQKADFDKLLSEEDRRYGTLSGMSLYEGEGRADELVFLAQVCMPGMDGGTHAKVRLSLQSRALTYELDDTPDLDILSSGQLEEEGV